MAKAKKKPEFLFVEVLQNGYPLTNLRRPLNKNGTITLGSNASCSLQLPHYPIQEKIELIHVNRRSVDVCARAEWDGFLTTSGDVIDLSEVDASEEIFQLSRGDYGTIHIGDLQILFRIGADLNHQPIVKKEAKKYRPGLFSLVLAAKEEKKSLPGAMFLAAIVFGGFLFAINNFTIYRPSKFSQLSSAYQLPFIHPEHLANIPEALQEDLDRRNYEASTINYIDALTAMLMNWDSEYKNLMYDNSVQRFDQLFEESRDTLKELVLQQDEVETASLAKPGRAMVSIPTVTGESLRTSIDRAFLHIDFMHENHAISLERRRQTLKEFAQDSSYDFEDYTNSKKKYGSAAQAHLSKISPFHLLSNEDRMYDTASRLAAKAGERRKAIQKRAAPKDDYHHPELQPIAMATGVNFVSFLTRAATLADDEKIEGLRASTYGSQVKVKIIEPLIGEINEKLIERLINKNSYELRLCYELALRRNKLLSGETEWSWRIDSRGEISQLSLLSSTIKDTKMINCLRRKIVSWNFPRPRHGSVEVRYPFHFSKSKG